MAKTLSVDLRRHVCAAISEGLSCHEAAARFGVSIASANRWQAQMRTSGDVTSKRRDPAGLAELRPRQSLFSRKFRTGAT
jgi:transposase